MSDRLQWIRSSARNQGSDSTLAYLLTLIDQKDAEIQQVREALQTVLEQHRDDLRHLKMLVSYGDWDELAEALETMR